MVYRSQNGAEAAMRRLLLSEDKISNAQDIGRETGDLCTMSACEEAGTKSGANTAINQY